MTSPNRKSIERREQPQGGEWPEQLAVKICWYYYMLGLTQQEVAERVGTNRVRVNRLLAEARQRGLVQVTINSRLADNVALEQRLIDRYGLQSATVLVTGDPADTEAAERLGRCAAAAVSGFFRDGMTIGIAWGVTLKALARTSPLMALRDVAVVSMLGSLSRRSSVDTFEATTDLASRLNAECYYLPGPIVCDSEAGRETILSQPMVQEVYAKILSADLAIVSVGGMDSATIRRMNVVSEEEYADVMRSDVIGNFLGFFIDSKAQVIDHPVNRRVFAVHPTEYVRIPRRVMVSGGLPKVPAIRALMVEGYLTDLVTDEQTARALLAD
ncbi:MAG: sugar-binding transcriptional regulator [Alphaproteobacteria bacterium]